jgi:hypothetical protein
MMKLKYFFLLTFLSLLIIVSCKNNNDEDEVSIQTKDFKSLPVDFQEFYMKFHSDTSFQYMHVSFPMQGHIIHKHPEGDTIESVTWTKKNWTIHERFDTNNKAFKQNFQIVSDNAVFETITGLEGMFKMEKRYAKLNDGWNLIYYSQQ